MNNFDIFQGDTSDIIYIRPGPLSTGEVIDANWICSTGVIDNAELLVIAARAVTDIVPYSIKNSDGSYTVEECFMCYLTPTETETLTHDDEKTAHTWIIELTNTTTTPPFNLKLHNNLKVKKQYI